jgi:hypothetical protein
MVRGPVKGVSGAVLISGLVLLFTACGGESEVSARQLRSLVLQPRDLPRDYLRFDVGPIAPIELHAGPREDASRFGRKGGWKARYKRSGSARRNGPLLVVSMIDLFDSRDGAKADLAAYDEEFGSMPRARRLKITGVGDTATGVTFTRGSGRYTIRFYRIAWREANTTASVSVDGSEGALSLSDASALARKQETRIRRAVGGS